MGPIFIALIFIHFVTAGATPTQTSLLNDGLSGRSLGLLISAAINIVIFAVVVGVIILAVVGALAIFAPGFLGSLTRDLRRMGGDDVDVEELNNLADKVLNGQQFLERLTAEINSLNKTPNHAYRRPKAGVKDGKYVYHGARV